MIDLLLRLDGNSLTIIWEKNKYFLGKNPHAKAQRRKGIAKNPKKLRPQKRKRNPRGFKNYTENFFKNSV